MKKTKRLILFAIIALLTMSFQFLVEAGASNVTSEHKEKEVIVSIDVWSTSEQVNPQWHNDLKELQDDLEVYEVKDLQNYDAGPVIDGPTWNIQLWRMEQTVLYVTDKYRTYPPYIRYIEPNYLIYPTGIASEQWGLHNIGQTGGKNDADIDLPEAENYAEGKVKEPVIIAVIDSGVDYNHDGLKNNMWTNPNPGDKNDIHGYNYCNFDNAGNPSDNYGHGTLVTGIIASVCPSAKIMALKFLNDKGKGYADKAIEGIYYAIKNNAKIINNSWESVDISEALKEAVEETRKKGILFVAGAGNKSFDNDTDKHYPSGYDSDNIIAVASTNNKDELSDFSNCGETSVDLGAPGGNGIIGDPGNIYSTAMGGGYAYGFGTSMATAHVSGVAALIWSLEPNLSCSEVKQRILKTADPVSSLNGKTVTGGRLNAYQAVIPQITITIDDTAGATGDTDISVAVSLENSMPVSSMQFRIRYDSDIGIHAREYKLTSRTQQLTAAVEIKENGTNSEVFVLLYDMSGASIISSGAGPILEILFNIDPDATPGTSALTFTECLISDASADQIPSNSTDTAAFVVTDSCEPPGDINSDSEINIFDLQRLINCITSTGSCECCDINKDGEHNIFDLQLLINKIAEPSKRKYISRLLDLGRPWVHG